jgi:beta-phosphoglucomutase-like phosphatase (HAD superfamily)
VLAVDAILFDPVGALAEFPAAPFEAAARVFPRSPNTGAHDPAGGSAAYWKLLDLIASCSRPLHPDERATIDAAEVEAVESALVYDDAAPALAELDGLGVRLVVASSLSESALSRFLDRAGWNTLFHDRWSRDAAEGVADAVLRRAVIGGSLDADRVLFLADTEAALRAATRVGVHPILMMNDPDEAMRLTAYNPAGGIVSLHELPDLVRLVAARHARRPVAPASFK